MDQDKKRCPWVDLTNPLYVAYHDTEWGRPVHDDTRHFELLVLGGAQAGLSWAMILKKRDNYRRAFAGFDPAKVARFARAKVAKLLGNPGIVRNRLKVESAVTNARAFLEIQEAYGSFDEYIWPFVGGAPIRSSLRRLEDYPAKTKESEALSKELRGRGFRFAGPTIVYAYMQAAGLVDDHTVDCFIRREKLLTSPPG